MKTKLSLICLTVFVMISKPVFSQDRESIFNMYYSMGVPTGNLADFTSKYSWRGFGMEYRSDVLDNVSMGFGAEWNVFYEALDYATYERDNIAVSGKQYRYANMFPMSARFHYYKDNAAGMRYFAGAGIGTTYMIHDLDMNIYRWNRDTWQFLVAPEVGIAYDVSPSNTLHLSLKYNLNFKTSDMESQSFLAINVGFGFR